MVSQEDADYSGGNTTKKKQSNSGNASNSSSGGSSVRTTPGYGTSTPSYTGGSSSSGSSSSSSSNPSGGNLATGISGLLGTAQQQPSQPSYLDTYMKKIDTMLPTTVQSNPFLNNAQSYYSQVMNPNYSAMSKEQQDQNYQTRAKDLIDNTFTPNENRWLSRMGSNSYTGSGRRYWNDQIANPENQILANLKTDIANQNWDATRQDKSTALGMLPTMSSIYSDNQRYPLETTMEWAKALLGDEQSKRQLEAAKAQAEAQQSQNDSGGVGDFFGGLLGMLF